MAFLEWRKFNFFELKRNVDDGRLAALEELNISVTTSGNNNLIIGDVSGQIHIVSRTWQITTFRAYELCVSLAQQLRNSTYLVTVGEDELGINPVLKVWDTGRFDKNSMPYNSRTTRLHPHNRGGKPSVLCVHESMQLMAIGFANGILLLYRGDVTRERGSRLHTLREASSSVTGLAFKSTASTTLLYVATENSIYIYNITQKDKEVMSLLDNNGCSVNCSVLAESLQESHFMVARRDAIYCYTSDGKGPCYAVDGEKVMIQWFRSYLIIVSKSTRLTPTQPAPTVPSNTQIITVLDIQNKFIVFQRSVDEIRSILNEWGGFYIIDVNNNIFHLNEKDLQAKLFILFKKNLYDIAIRIAKSQQYDSDGLVDIFRQYGDHLYSKSDHAGAIDQYVKTIGKLEPSYVIRKFMDSKHIDKLTSYLEALHKQGHATEDHTTLLLNCFTKLNKTADLKEFILQKDKELDFDVDIAIKVCRQGSPEEALMLAKRHHKHNWYIKLQLEDHRRYGEIIDYISDLSFDDAQLYMKKYGGVLVRCAAHRATQFLKRLCGNFGRATGSGERQRANAEDYIHLFLNDSARLVEFLDYLISEGCALSAAVYDTLLEHYLHVWESVDEPERARFGQKILKLLQNPDVQCDKHQALVVCHMHGFSDGILHLYEEQKLYQQILRYHIAQKDTSSVLACCKRFGHQEPTLWVQSMWSCVRDPDYSTDNLLPEVLDTIAKERLLSPQLVIEALGTGKAEITLAHVKRYVTQELRKEQEVTAADRELTHKYRKDTNELKRKLEHLKCGPILIQGARCAACHHPLELPSLHFLCQHSYHQHCFQSYAENENECLACQPDNKKVVELLRAREYNKDLHETFHSQLDKAPDGFALAAEYFGRGVFNTVKVITERPRAPPPPVAVQQPLAPREEPPPVVAGSEARVRLQENKRSTPIVNISEGRVRMQENRFSSSLEANIIHPRAAEVASVVVGSVSSNASSKRPPAPASDNGNGGNPFETEDDATYDKAMNPFGDDDEEPKTSCKDEEDDYDKNLNPFA